MTTAVVTGDARGIGRAIGERLADDGFGVIGVDIDASLAETGFEPVQVDLTAHQGRAAVAAAVERLGAPLGVLVNNAGITADARLVNLTEDDVSRVLEVNLGVPYLLPGLTSPEPGRWHRQSQGGMTHGHAVLRRSARGSRRGSRRRT